MRPAAKRTGLLVLVFGCGAWIPLAIWIYALVAWMITGDIDPVSGIVGVFLGVGLGALALAPPIPMLSPISFAAAVLTLIFTPIVRFALNTRELRQVDLDALERAYETLAMRPNNPVSLMQVARRAYSVGMPGHALMVAERAVANLPLQHFRDEHRLVSRWKASVTAPEYFRPMPCVDCGSPNAPGAVHCAQCGAPFLLDHARGRALGKGQGRRLVAAWIGLVGILVGIGAATALPPVLGALAILLLLAASGWIVYLAFRSGGGRA